MADDEDPQPKVVIIPAPIWLLSFGDTIALMLAFFVMLFAMSSVKQEIQLSRIIASVTSEDPEILSDLPVPNSNLAIENVKIYNGLSMDYLYELIEEKINDTRTLDSLEVTLEEESVLITLPSNIFVSLEDPRINELGQKILYELGLILAPISNVIQVEGHESAQLRSEERPFTNRWELRLLRASAVAQEIRRAGLLSSTKILGSPLDNFNSSPTNQVPAPKYGDNGVDLRITKIAGGQ